MDFFLINRTNKCLKSFSIRGVTLGLTFAIRDCVFCLSMPRLRTKWNFLSLSSDGALWFLEIVLQTPPQKFVLSFPVRLWDLALHLCAPSD